MRELRWWFRYRVFKWHRRNLEAHLFTIGALNAWHRVKDENDLLGVWRSGKGDGQ